MVFESPTGSGKTIAVLSALIPVAREKGKKILYLCRTHEQMDRVIEELRMISKDENLRGLSMRARRDMCLNPIIRENTRTTGEGRFACSILKKEGKCTFYKNLGRINTGLPGPVSASEVVSLCRSKGVCPYEFCRSQLSKCDVIALSYLYVFEPGIRAAFLNAVQNSLDDFILVLDEAHNLPRQAVEIAGERLTEFVLSRAIKEAEDQKAMDASRLLKNLYRFMVEQNSVERQLPKDTLTDKIGLDTRTLNTMEDVGEKIRKKGMIDGKKPISHLYSTAAFARHWINSPEDETAFFASKTNAGAPSLEILSLEPRSITKPPLEGAHLSVHLSGTMAPIKPYCELIGLENYTTRVFPSPFPKENIAAFTDAGVSTMGALRTREMYARMAGKIERYLRAVPGNVLVFFPSYVVLRSVLDSGLRTDKEVFLERSNMTSSENNEMIKRFKDSRNAVLFGVQQGRNSEGQDFPGEKANCVIVVGIPYSVRGPKVNAQIEYYKKKYPGWWGKHTLGEFYAYYLPAYRALNQAAGRAHRSLDDKAAIIFMERRVAFDRKVRENISPWISGNLNVSDKIEEELKEFYSTIEGQSVI